MQYSFLKKQPCNPGWRVTSVQDFFCFLHLDVGFSGGQTPVWQVALWKTTQAVCWHESQSCSALWAFFTFFPCIVLLLQRQTADLWVAALLISSAQRLCVCTLRDVLPEVFRSYRCSVGGTDRGHCRPLALKMTNDETPPIKERSSSANISIHPNNNLIRCTSRSVCRLGLHARWSKCTILLHTLYSMYGSCCICLAYNEKVLSILRDTILSDPPACSCYRAEIALFRV